MPIILLRHTTPNVAANTCYGCTDVGLASTFLSEANTTFQALPKIDSIVSSPLTRCIKLAEYISSKSNIPFSIDPRFQEMNFGTWENIAWTDVPRHELDAWAADFMHANPHGGESVMQLSQRVREALTGLTDDKHNTLIITHAGVIKAAFSNGDTAEDFKTKVEFGKTVLLSEMPFSPF